MTKERLAELRELIRASARFEIADSTGFMGEFFTALPEALDAIEALQSRHDTECSRLAIECDKLQAEVTRLRERFEHYKDYSEKLEDENKRLREALKDVIAFSMPGNTTYAIARKALEEE